MHKSKVECGNHAQNVHKMCENMWKKGGEVEQTRMESNKIIEQMKLNQERKLMKDREKVQEKDEK